MKRNILSLVLAIATFATLSAQAPEPYLARQARPIGAVRKASPDPNAHYRWDNPSPLAPLEIYTLLPSNVMVDNKDAAQWRKAGGSIEVISDCNLMFDFGCVSAGWLEFDCDNLGQTQVECSISEYNEPAIVNTGSARPHKTLAPVAYTVRLNLLQDHLGAILMDRGDRHSWTGDAYISQAVSMLVFGNYGLVRENLLKTATQDNGIASYNLLWVLSLVDWPAH